MSQKEKNNDGWFKKKINKMRFFPAIIFTLFLLQGCQNTNNEPNNPLDMSNGSLYLNNDLYQQLYVEIDTLKGTEVSPVLIEEIRDFLNEHCSKPGGIKIVQDMPVSFGRNDLSIGLMSILCTDGPPEHLKEQPAYLHVFFYDSDIKNIKTFTREPHVQAQCPTTVFMNIDYAKIDHISIKRHFIRHELGHVLGLCSNTNHGNGGHCDNKNCLMHHSPDLISSVSTMIQIPMRDKKLCNECLTDICNMKNLPSDGLLSFKGPFWVKEDGENLTFRLPYYRLTISKDDADSVHWKELLSKSKNEIEQKLDQFVDSIKEKKQEISLGSKYKR